MMNATIGSIKSIRKGRNSVMVKIIFKAVFVDGFGDVKIPRASARRRSNSFSDISSSKQFMSHTNLSISMKTHMIHRQSLRIYTVYPPIRGPSAQSRKGIREKDGGEATSMLEITYFSYSPSANSNGRCAKARDRNRHIRTVSMF